MDVFSKLDGYYLEDDRFLIDACLMNDFSERSIKSCEFHRDEAIGSLNCYFE